MGHCYRHRAPLRAALLGTSALVAASVAVISMAAAQSSTWTGAIDNIYGTAGNWSGGAPPPDTDTKSAIFATGGANTNVNVAARQVLAQGTRPLSPSGRIDKTMHFVKMRSDVRSPDQVSTWQALHAKAVEATPGFADGLAGYEVCQRLADAEPRQPNRCGQDLPVADLVASFWFKTKTGSALFPGYVRALRRADQQATIDGPASFFVFVDEVEVWTNTSFIG